MTRLARASLVAALALVATATRLPAASASDDAIVEVHFAMGTPVAITARGDDEAHTRTAMRAAFGEIRRLETLLTVWNPDSETSRLNRDAGRAPRAIAPELADVLRTAQRLGRETGGAFSVLVGPVVDAWRAAEPDAPDAAQLARASALADPRGLVLDAHGRAALRHAGMRVDLDGIAKGVAADRALALLRAHGVHAAIVNLGGSSMAAFGDAGDGARGWPVELPTSEAASAAAAARPPAVVRLVDEALSVSASGVGEPDGDDAPPRRRTIVDPRTGRRIAHDATALVLHRSATDAEAWSKALLVRGADDTTGRAGFGIRAMLLLDDRAGAALCTARFRNPSGVCKVPSPAAASIDAPRDAQERLGG